MAKSKRYEDTFFHNFAGMFDIGSGIDQIKRDIHYYGNAIKKRKHR